MAENESARASLFEQLRDKVQEWLGAECAPASPCPFPYPAGECQQERSTAIRTKGISGGAVVINGVALPETVARQLRQLGLPLKWYNHGELEETAEATSFNRTLVKNPAGHNFHEIIHYPAEKKEMHELHEIAADIGKPVRALTHSMLGVTALGISGFGNIVEDMQDRLDDIRSVAFGMCGPAPIPSTALFTD